MSFFKPPQFYAAANNREIKQRIEAGNEPFANRVLSAISKYDGHQAAQVSIDNVDTNLLIVVETMLTQIGWTVRRGTIKDRKTFRNEEEDVDVACWLLSHTSSQ